MSNLKKIQTRQQAGLTLIELMIAMTLGLLLLAGVLGIFISNNRSAKFTKEQAAIQQDGRFAVDYIRKFMHNGGLDNWFSPLDTRSKFGAEVSLLGSSDAGVKPSDDGENIGNDDYDRLVIEYEVTPSMTNLFSCNGFALTNRVNTRIREIFTVRNNQFGCKSLYKSGNMDRYKNIDGTDYAEGTDTGFAVLIGGVRAFQIVYGMNLSADLYASPDKVKYLNATQIKDLESRYSQSDLSKRIMTIKYALLINSDTDLDTVSRVQNMNFKVLDKDVVVTGRMPNLYTSTFKIRNGG